MTRKVTCEEFYSYMGPKDVALHLEPTFTIWETKDRREVGRSWPGWKNPEGEKHYQINEDNKS